VTPSARKPERSAAPAQSNDASTGKPKKLGVASGSAAIANTPSSGKSPQSLALAAALAEAATPRKGGAPTTAAPIGGGRGGDAPTGLHRAPTLGLEPPSEGQAREIEPPTPPVTDATDASAEFVRASVEAASAVARLQKEISEHVRRLSELSHRLREQTAITDALTSALAAQRKDGGSSVGDA
jgi:hypothetical protein